MQTLSTGRLTPPSLVRGGTPPSLAGFFAPRLAPGIAALWETLPFVEIGERPRPTLAEPGADPDATTLDPTSDWVAWGAMLLALCLVLSALLIQ
jgi:hypothetical protein